LRKTAIKEVKLPYYHRSEEAYFDAMSFVVANSNLLIAVWDGKNGHGRGGTADAIKIALDSNYDWIHIDVADQTTKFYLNKISGLN
jgi:hypothetical protein